ncbi:hypothetical protein P171DRAFT_448164 [Karstenula rhodostoma CBS 690.94]|uniref:Integral membrane protein TmpA n=1 Tax=Karstenula rhodostoma CBS 690.94 TaxID=1392251 RepID=A0A9P4U7N2_9PLEO|nr:hypothetical protein P171DRAFT_448164 [Karstenula rhodostoma CBS 690.94]
MHNSFEQQQRWNQQAIQVRDRTMPVAQPSLSPPKLTPALHFDPEKFSSSRQDSNVPEKALVQSGRFRVNADCLDHINDMYSPHGIRKDEEIYTLLPGEQYSSAVRYLRFSFLTVYRRLFTFIVLLNLIPLCFILHQTTITLDTLATAASTNFLFAILIRQDFLINGVFRVAWLVPWRVPLAVRRWIARCYCYGGIHSGAAMAGTAWWTAFSVVSTMQMAKQGLYSIPLLMTTWTILATLTLIIVFALPGFRKTHHNMFELTHRFLGWTCILLFWAQLLLVINHTAPPAQLLTTLLHTPTSWNLTCITALVAYPWLTLRIWVFHPTVLSPHAIRLHFAHPVHKFSCLSISTSPLKEWHPFATFPTPTQNTQISHPDTSTSILLSDAGDWTHALIRHAQSLTAHHTRHNPAPPQLRLWVKPTPIPGVLSLTTLFPRVLLITTGSGIGPCLSSLLARPAAQFVRLVWSARAPAATYGAALLGAVHAADPDALVVDTQALGRPDLSCTQTHEGDLSSADVTWEVIPVIRRAWGWSAARVQCGPRDTFALQRRAKMSRWGVSQLFRPLTQPSVRPQRSTQLSPLQRLQKRLREPHRLLVCRREAIASAIVRILHLLAPPATPLPAPKISKQHHLPYAFLAALALHLARTQIEKSELGLNLRAACVYEVMPFFLSVCMVRESGSSPTWYAPVPHESMLRMRGWDEACGGRVKLWKTPSDMVERPAGVSGGVWRREMGGVQRIKGLLLFSLFFLLLLLPLLLLTSLNKKKEDNKKNNKEEEKVKKEKKEALFSPPNKASIFLIITKAPIPLILKR